MFCVAKTFLLCTRWSFLWYVWSYCMCYYLTHFLNVWSYVEMHHLDGFVPIWKMKTQIKVIFKNDYCLRYVIIRSSDQQGSVLKKKKRFSTCLITCGKLLFSCCNNKSTVISNGAFNSSAPGTWKHRIIWVTDEIYSLCPDRNCK